MKWMAGPISEGTQTDEVPRPSSYCGKWNVHQLAREIAANTNEIRSEMETIIRHMKGALDRFRDAIQMISTKNLHVMHQLAHPTSWEKNKVNQLNNLKEALLDLTQEVMNLPRKHRKKPKSYCCNGRCIGNLSPKVSSQGFKKKAMQFWKSGVFSQRMGDPSWSGFWPIGPYLFGTRRMEKKKHLGSYVGDFVDHKQILALSAGTGLDELRSFQTHDMAANLHPVTWQLIVSGVCGADRFTSSSIGDVVQKIVMKEGPAALMKGLKPRMLFHAPAAAICWSTYEASKSFLQHSDVK
eukprot:Gb_18478 [translate_table: standard]